MTGQHRNRPSRLTSIIEGQHWCPCAACLCRALHSICIQPRSETLAVLVMDCAAADPRASQLYRGMRLRSDSGELGASVPTPPVVAGVSICTLDIFQFYFEEFPGSAATLTRVLFSSGVHIDAIILIVVQLMALPGMTLPS